MATARSHEAVEHGTESARAEFGPESQSGPPKHNVGRTAPQGLPSQPDTLLPPAGQGALRGKSRALHTTRWLPHGEQGNEEGSSQLGAAARSVADKVRARLRKGQEYAETAAETIKEATERGLESGKEVFGTAVHKAGSQAGEAMEDARRAVEDELSQAKARAEEVGVSGFAEAGKESAKENLGETGQKVKQAMDNPREAMGPLGHATGGKFGHPQ